jgi:receptor-type tyrosine-protein phosphatase F
MNAIAMMNFSRQGKYECVAENTIGTEHSKPINLYVKIRRVPPQFSRPPDPVNEVLLGGNLNLTCVAVGSPMPLVKWRKGLDEDITPENELPVGKSVLQLNDIRSSVNYTCIASSSLGVIEALAMVKVQCKHLIRSLVFPSHKSAFFGICSLANCTDGFEVIITFD